MIRASAGSGKTWQLSNRIVQLLVMGFPVDRVVALTFTRNAAGEFFDAVLKKLADAAASDEAASQLNQDIGMDPPPSAERYREVLLSLLYQLQEIHFGTLDSFFCRIVSAYTLELGLPAQVQLMGTHEAHLHRQHVLESILNPRHTAGRAFVEAFDQATWGAEEKNLDSLLGNFIDSHFSAYEKFPGDSLQWPEPLTTLAEREAQIDIAGLKTSLRTALGRAELADKRMAKWDDAVNFLLEWQPKQTLLSPAKTFFGNIMKGYQPQDQTCPAFTLDRQKLSLDEEGAQAFGQLCELWLSRTLQRSFQKSQGILQLQKLYESVGHDYILHSGRIDYSDLTHLLTTLPLENRQAVEFRIDQMLDHWLLDEFQDTSRDQWQGIAPLVEEVLQDPEGDRSFFCVGDSKQSLYGWRGGDSRLFDEILTRFRKTIDTRQLDSTWRCAPPVVSLINQVFTANPHLLSAAPDVAARWDHLWSEHRAERAFPGYAAVYEVPDAKSAEEDSPEAIDTIIELLREIDPLRRGLSCAILTPRNKDSRVFADTIQEKLHWPVLVEGAAWIARDNPFGLVLLAAARQLTHPRDTLASGWLKGLRPDTKASETSWRLQSLELISRQGFRAWAHSVWNHYLPGITGHQTRKRQLVEALNQFDQQESRDPHTLESFLENLEVRSGDSTGAIQCMTIHASKGLGFDIVILACLDSGNQGILQRRNGPLIAERDDRSVEWVMEAPERAMIDAIPECAKHYTREVNDNAFEKWCLLYVAMTRAKAGLYVFTEPRETAKALRLSDLISATSETKEPVTWLDISSPQIAHGDPNWFSSRKPQPPATEKPLPEHLSFKIQQPKPHPKREAPSTHAHRLFSDPPEFGIRLHELAATLDRPGISENIRLLDELKPADPITREARDALLLLLQSDTGPRLFEPEDGTTIWIEKAFAWNSPDGFVKGRWDRVHLVQDASGRPQEATFFDFKTDRDSSQLKERYTPQMEAYRRALAAVTHLPIEKVHGHLVHVPSCSLINL
jgi:ATP-dependent helicase/nuclease subunit A